jgi:hypothetical protein
LLERKKVTTLTGALNSAPMEVKPKCYSTSQVVITPKKRTTSDRLSAVPCSNYRAKKLRASAFDRVRREKSNDADESVTAGSPCEQQSVHDEHAVPQARDHCRIEKQKAACIDLRIDYTTT